jgi:hypothetical protein
MTAGLPGVGLSGIFFIVSALLMVPLEIAHTIRGRSSLARWLCVLRHLAIAISMIVALELMYAALRLGINELEATLGSHTTSAHRGIRLLPFAPVVATLALIACLLLIAKTAELRARRPKPRSAHARPRSVSAPPPRRSLGAGRET